MEHASLGVGRAHADLAGFPPYVGTVTMIFGIPPNARTAWSVLQKTGPSLTGSMFSNCAPKQIAVTRTPSSNDSPHRAQTIPRTYPLTCRSFRRSRLEPGMI
jgi:hypothetical protein